MKCHILILFIFILFTSCNTPSTTPTIIATNGWTAAYAIAAGAEEVLVLAPYQMTHPSEYELRPGDIQRLSKSKLIIYAGYEVMIDQIKKGLDIPTEKMVQIATNYCYQDIDSAVMQIARRLNTESIAIKNLEKIKSALDEGYKTVHKLGYDQQPLLVHFFQASLARELGIKHILVFGPAPLEPKQILEMSQSKAIMILDNAHNPAGDALKEVLKESQYKLLLNFPGLHHTRTLDEVINYNIEQLK